MIRFRLWLARLALPRGFHVQRNRVSRTASKAQIPLPMPLTAA